MADSSIQRRQVLRGAGIAAGGVAVTGVGAAVAPAAASDGRDRGTWLTGSWMLDVHNDDGSDLVSVVSFSDGGVCVLHDISPAGPPWTGTWAVRRRDQWRTTVWTGFPGETGPGTVGPTAELHLSGTGDRVTLEGVFDFTVFDPAGTPVATGSGTLTGSPIDA